MSKSINQNRNEAESNEFRGEIGRDREVFNSIEDFQNLAECSDDNEDNSFADFMQPSNVSEQSESILITDKGILKWQNNFEDLRLAVDRLQLKSGNWTSPGGCCKLFQNGEVSIRWYSNSKTLTLKGEKADEIKEKLLQFDCKSSSEAVVYQESPKVANLNSILKSPDRYLHTRPRICSLNTEIDKNYNKSPEIYEINSKLKSYTENVNGKLEALAEEISTIKEKKEEKAYAILVLEEVVNDLKKEKLELIRENEELKEKNKNLFQSLSEVRAKVIELQDEKSSLITALKLIQRDQVPLAERKRIEDLESENENLRAAARSLQEEIDKDRKRNREFVKVTKRGGNASITPQASLSYESKNQYEVLADSEQEDVNDSISETSLSTEHPEARQHQVTARELNTTSKAGKTTVLETEQSKDKVGSRIHKDGKSKPNILLIGDSMIKGINPHKLSKSSVRKLTYPGKRAEEIANEVLSAHLHSRPTEVILQAGTNNLITDSSKECFDNIQVLSSRIKSKFKEARIAISSLITREDVDVALKIQETNELLKEFCLKEGYTYIENGNIDATCLNGSQLHLNAKGSALLAVHFIKFLRGSSTPSRSRGFPKEFRQLGELLRLIMPQTSKRRARR